MTPMTTTVPVQRDLKAVIREEAARMRGEFGRSGTLVINVLSSPGAGKTSLLEAVARHWRGARRMGVLVGDLETDRDARRLAPYCPTRQLTTGGACHLELPLVQRGLRELDTPDLEFLFIENVGNLVCPASHDLAEHLRIVLLSTTEGDDKPGKYPKMFRTSQAMVISKVDLLPHVPFSVDAAVADARLIQPALHVFTLSALHGTGVAEFCRFLDKQRAELIRSAAGWSAADKASTAAEERPGGAAQSGP